MSIRTEFYEAAVRFGYYGLDRSGLTGKKDNVRKYWEDISIKLTLRQYLEKILAMKKRISVLDLGCGSGEGFELLTHIPVEDHVNSVDNDFLLNPGDIEQYTGLDISLPMIEQGRTNYTGHEAISFEQCDLSKGLPESLDGPYDVYFSSYASLSHLTCDELAKLTGELMARVEKYGIIVYDLLGKYSPEWPVYWEVPGHCRLPYNMAYLCGEDDTAGSRFEQFKCSFWSPESLSSLIISESKKKHTAIIMAMHDRSIFVGRHMDTGIFNNCRRRYRYQVNRLFDRDFRGVLNDLVIDLDFIHDHAGSLPSPALDRLTHYMRQWNFIISFIGSLADSNRAVMSNVLQNSDASLADDLEMLSWLYRNASRFPVTDFWASVMGPQVACVIRNLEMGYNDAAGCGHGLFCIIEVIKS